MADYTWITASIALSGALLSACAAPRPRVLVAPEPALSIASTASPTAAPAAPEPACSTRVLGPLGEAVLGIERCDEPRAPRFVAARRDSLVAALPLDPDLAGSGWEAFATRFRSVPAPGAAISSVMFHRRLPDGKRTKDEWMLVALAYGEAGLSVVARIGPLGGDAILTHAIEDLDGDGVPELRVGIAKQFHGEREIQTFSLGPRGFDRPWERGSRSARDALSPSLCRGADRAIHRADPRAPDHVPCDSVLDFERIRVTDPSGASLLLASGPYAACDGTGCPVAVVREAGGDVLVRSFGFIAVDTSGPRLAIAVQKAPGEDARAHRYCFEKHSLGRCDDAVIAAKTPWASLAPVRDRSNE